VTTHVVPPLSRTQSHRGWEDSHEMYLKRVNEYGERASGLVVGELTLTDLRAIADVVNDYLEATGA
jgi:hypothetical protein